MDSLVVVRLLARLEDEFGFVVDVERLDLDDFRSVSSIARYVAGVMDRG
jgi:acyl carrier protein